VRPHSSAAKPSARAGFSAIATDATIAVAAAADPGAAFALATTAEAAPGRDSAAFAAATAAAPGSSATTFSAPAPTGSSKAAAVATRGSDADPGCLFSHFRHLADHRRQPRRHVREEV
jgi:hypothetical protein